MKIGILSDSHDAMDNTRAAMAALSAKSCGLIIHAGDFVAPFMMPLLAEPGIRVEAVFGNNDGEKFGLDAMWKKFLAPLGGALGRGPRHIEVEGRKILIMHEPDEIEALLDSGRFDLIIHGHTHNPILLRKGNSLLVNPGEVFGALTKRRTVAVYETETGQAEIIDF